MEVNDWMELNHWKELYILTKQKQILQSNHSGIDNSLNDWYEF